jgi:carbonic anhydrase/acetyltransferase-like protein (isoleucine patch superfamily)
MSSEAFEGLMPVIDPRAWVHASAQLLGDVRLAEDVSVWPTSVLRGDCGTITVGARTNVQDGTIAHATRGFSKTTVGVECTLGHRVILHGCTVGDRCLVGMGAILLDGAELGDECFVAAGSLVPPGKKFEARSFLVGSPAKRVREVTPKDLELIERSWRTYVDLMRGYLPASSR